MYEFSYDSIKPKFKENTKYRKFFYMDTDSFIVCIKQKIFIQTFQIINFEDDCLKERKKRLLR